MLNSVLFLSIPQVFQNTLFKLQSPLMKTRFTVKGKTKKIITHTVQITNGRVYLLICKTLNIYSTFSVYAMAVNIFCFICFESLGEPSCSCFCLSFGVGLTAF